MFDNVIFPLSVGVVNVVLDGRATVPVNVGDANGA